VRRLAAGGCQGGAAAPGGGPGLGREASEAHHFVDWTVDPLEISLRDSLRSLWVTLAATSLACRKECEGCRIHRGGCRRHKERCRYMYSGGVIWNRNPLRLGVLFGTEVSGRFAHTIFRICVLFKNERLYLLEPTRE